MKAIITRCKKTRSILGGAVFIGRDCVVPFGTLIYKNSVLGHETFKNGDFKHYLGECFNHWDVEAYKQFQREKGKNIFFQEVISNG